MQKITRTAAQNINTSRSGYFIILTLYVKVHITYFFIYFRVRQCEKLLQSIEL